MAQEIELLIQRFGLKISYQWYFPDIVKSSVYYDKMLPELEHYSRVLDHLYHTDSGIIIIMT